ncbi:MAG: hypothetical protein JNM20_04490 [Rhizobiales bacterium]|nr:hypothetical protein [Hyphomicrobiales bacterium]
MTNSPRQAAAIRRVLVGLSSADMPTAMLDLATQLAHAFHAEVAGLFVEEDMLFHLSGYPAAQVLRRGGRPEVLERGRIDAELAAQARAWRRALSACAERSHVSWSFESRRGDALTILRGSARADDVLLIGGTASTITLRARIALAVEALGAARAALVMPERIRRQRGQVVAFSDGEADDRAVDLAARIARAMGESLLILTREHSHDSEARGERARILELASEDPESIAMLLRRLEPRLVVAQSGGPVFADVGTAAALMHAAGAPLLLLRSGV